MKLLTYLKNIKSIHKKLRKLYKWWELIDKDYDYCFLLQTHRLKMQEMVEFYKSDNFHIMNPEEVVKQLEIGISILDRLIADDYSIAKDWKMTDRANDLKAYLMLLNEHLFTWWD